jgi:hypothetical protein
VEGLGFRIEQLPDGRWVKYRDDGRRGLCVGNEAELWQALRAAGAQLGGFQEALARRTHEVDELHDKLEALSKAPLEAQARPAAAAKKR